jgi:signal transduction protein with GAF and PtsI domain
LGVTVYVCNRASCQDAHEQKCGHSLREKYARLSELKDTLVEALNGMNDLFREAEGQSVFVIRKLGGGITNGDQDRIDAVITKLDAALSAAALFEQEKGTK